MEGLTAPGYEGVADAMATCGPGVAVAAIVDGQVVVDATTEGLTPRTLVHTWSAIKPVTGACVLALVDRGRLDLDQPVASVWPELGDDRLLVRHVLTHCAGRIACPDADLTDWSATTSALAAQPPDAAPGEIVCEHAITFGFLAGELVRRVDGRTLGTFLREELTGPLGLDVHVGVPTADLHRVADTVGLDDAYWADVCGDAASLRARSLGPRPDVHTDAWRTSEIPAVNGHATALGLATFHQRLLEGRLPPLVDRPGVTAHDHFVGEEVTWSLAGGQIGGDDIGMGGLGGQWAAARPADALAWAFLTSHVGDFERAQRVEDALLAALG
ncbi:beta-lactamase family protein [Acidimicrobiia bacterium EGI L10123]|uniref:serine hydrolase domain-containing protein n=1 Tax=Salinilacustrithrix flava TaxID=2957203 RepID=UPI003D7C324F|nr:beta-lactamase family protein [Acidimicrobiia bacterium EGI L10123]